MTPQAEVVSTEFTKSIICSRVSLFKILLTSGYIPGAYTTSQGVLEGLIQTGIIYAGQLITGLKKAFKTRYIAVLLKLIFEFTQFFRFKTSE